MAWKKESTASRRARVAKQLRDKHGKWIEMGGGVKWFKNGSWHNGTASAFKGNNVVVTMKDGSEQLVNHREIEPIRAKASLKPAKPEGSVQAKKAPGKASKESVVVKDNDPDKRLTSNASDLEEGDEVYAGGESFPKRFSMDNKEAERNEEAGFKVRLDSNGEPERARVVDTSGENVILEDSNGKRYEIPKTDNVLIDDEEMDAALQNADDNDEVPNDVDDFDVKSVDPKDLNIPEEAIAAYKKGVTASKGGDLAKAEEKFDEKNGSEYLDDFTVGYQDGIHIADGARDKFQGLYHKYAQLNKGSKEEPKAELPKKNESDLPLDGLDLSEEDKKRINEAETGEEALKALKDSEAGEYLAIARQNKNKEFVDAYRKAVNDINDKHQVVEKKEAEAPAAEEKKSAGTPVEAIEKSVANLSEDLKEIDGNELDDDAESAALADAAYDIKNDNGEEFLLTGSRNEEGDWQVDVSDSDGNVIGSHNPKDAGSSQKLAQAIQDSINSNQSSKDSDAPTEEPEAPADSPDGDDNDSKESESDSRIAKTDDNGDIHLAEGENFQSLDIEDEDEDGNELEPIEAEGKVFREDGYYLDQPQDSDSDGADLYSPDGKRIAAIFGEGLTADADSIADKHKSGEDISELPAVKRAKGDSPDGEDDSEEPKSPSGLDSLKEIGFSDKDVEAIANAKDETEARKLFFQSPSGKKVNQENLERQQRDKEEGLTTEDLDDQDAYDKASKEFEDFVQANYKTGKPEADKKLAEDLKERAEIDAEHTPEGQDAKAKNTVEQMKDRKDGASDEKKLAELDRKIIGAEKMLKTTKDEKLKKRIESDIARFKSEKEELSQPKAEKEEAPTASQGSDYSVPEDGVTPLKDKLSQNDQKRVEFLKAGDKFLGERSETGGFRPVGATQTRATPDGHTWEVTDVKKEGMGGAQTTVTAKNSSGEEVSFTAGVGERKKSIVLDTPGARKTLGLGSNEKEAENADDSERVSSDARSTVDEATADAQEELADGKTWEDLKDRVWPVENSDGEYVAVGARSTEEDKFLGHYDKDDEELDTFPFEGGNDDREQSEAEGESDGGSGDGDSGGPDVSDSDSGTESGDGETSYPRGLDVDVPQEEYDEKLYNTFGDDKGESAADGARAEFSDGYSVLKEELQDGTDRYKLYIKDEEDRTVAFFWPQKLGENYNARLRALTNSHKKMRRLNLSNEDTDGRRANDISRDDARMASVGTQLSDDDGNTFTKIGPTTWARNLDDKDSELAEVSPLNPEDRKWNYSHDIDDRREKNLDKLLEDELRQRVSEFDRNIRDVVRREGEIQDADRYGKRITPQMIDEHQRKRYEAYAIHTGAKDYSDELWKRMRESGEDNSPIDTGDFSPNNSSETPNTNKNGSMLPEVWFKLRNEYVGIDSKTVAMNSELRNSDNPSRAAKAWGTKMDKWANSGELADDYELFRSVLASPDRAAQYKPGALIEDKGIMSVGDNMETAETYLAARSPRTAGKIPVMLTIEGRKGTPMIAAEGGSDELVLPRGSKLFVSSVKDDEDGIRHVRAVLNPSEAEIAEWTGKKAEPSSEAPEVAPEAPSIPDVEAPTSPEVEAPAATEAKPGFKAVEGFAAGDRVFHPKHGAGEIVRRESNGQYARIKFDGSGKIMGISLTKVTAGDSAPDAPAKATTPKAPSAKAVPLKSGSTAETEGWSVGEAVTHGKHGTGKIARLEGNGEYARVQFDNLPEGTLKGIKLSQLGRNGESKTTPPVSESGEFKVDGRVAHKGNKGEGTIKKISDDGTFALIEFDNEPGKLRGIRFSRLNSGVGSFKDPDTKVEPKDHKKDESDIVDPTTKIEDPKSGSKSAENAQPKLYVGAVIVHAQLGRGRVVKVGSGKNPIIQIVFDNDPTGKPRSLATARLKDIAIEPKKQS